MTAVSKLEFVEGEKVFEAHVAVPAGAEGERRPVVFVCHAWAGQGDFERRWAQDVAELGYVGAALDVYGKGVVGNGVEENQALMEPLMAERGLLLRRLVAGIDAVKQHPNVEREKSAVVGFCFGGLAALDLARADVGLGGAVSVHGLLVPPADAAKGIRTRVLALHGHDDPMVPPDAVRSFEREMDAAGADWQLHIYGGTKHAFTNPLANDPALGTVYSKVAAARATSAIHAFLGEVFA